MFDDWEILDTAALDTLVGRKGAAALMSGLDAQPGPLTRAERLRHLASRGDVMGIRDEAKLFHDWAEAHALRRLSNALTELERCAELKARGQAILQAQALTRFITGVVADDVALLRQALSDAA